MLRLVPPAAPAAGEAQTSTEERRDTLANGTRIGLGAGAALGLFDLGPEGMVWCRTGGRACIQSALEGAVVGGAIGLGIDALRDRKTLVVPGFKIDDGVGRGAVIGLAAGTLYGLERALDGSCLEGPNRPCSRGRSWSASRGHM